MAWIWKRKISQDNILGKRGLEIKHRSIISRWPICETRCGQARQCLRCDKSSTQDCFVDSSRVVVFGCPRLGAGVALWYFQLPEYWVTPLNFLQCLVQACGPNWCARKWTFCVDVECSSQKSTVTCTQFSEATSNEHVKCAQRSPEEIIGLVWPSESGLCVVSNKYALLQTSRRGQG